MDSLGTVSFSKRILLSVNHRIYTVNNFLKCIQFKFYYFILNCVVNILELHFRNNFFLTCMALVLPHSRNSPEDRNDKSFRNVIIYQPQGYRREKPNSHISSHAFQNFSKEEGKIRLLCPKEGIRRLL
jgi:hypothetical protein